MKCPLCNKEMIEAGCDVFSMENPIIIAEQCKCDCGVVYQFLEGAERYIKDGK